MQNPPIRVCAHLQNLDLDVDDAEFYVVLRGPKLQHDLCCHKCADGLKAGQIIEWLDADTVYMAAIEEQEWSQLGWIGEPIIEEDLQPFHASLQVVEFPGALAKCRAVLPLDGECVLGFDGQSVGFFESDRFSPLLNLAWAEEDNQNWSGHALTPRFHLSPSRRFVALVNDFGRFGQVLDLEERRVTMRLDRGEYHPETQPFPIAFFQKDERDLLVHAVDWNRLEISDPQNGLLLTPRDALKYEKQAPEHYLDYFHGALHVSPDGKRIADDGWVWHPVGVVVTWSLDDWLNSNVYESEDGASHQSLTNRAYFWNGAMCWIDNQRLAIAGLGFDDNAMLDGVRIFNVEQKRELEPFAGPSNSSPFWSDGQRLFSVAGDETQIWRLDGTRIGRIAGFAPQFQIEGALVEIEGSRMKIWRFDD